MFTTPQFLHAVYKNCTCVAKLALSELPELILDQIQVISNSGSIHD